MSDIPKFIKHFKASAAYHRKKAEQAEAEVARLEALLDQQSAQHSVQRTADHAADCAINVGMLGECDCGAE
jgi:hypothetical protein